MDDEEVKFKIEGNDEVPKNSNRRGKLEDDSGEEAF